MLFQIMVNQVLGVSRRKNRPEVVAFLYSQGAVDDGILDEEEEEEEEEEEKEKEEANEDDKNNNVEIGNEDE
jgi:hypothetical protein